MCRKCEPILGPRVKKHSEADCPLAQAARCSFCGTSGHFSKSCHRKPTTLSDSAEPIPTIQIAEQKNTYLLGDSPDAHVEYLKLYDIEPASRKEKNKTLVTNHLKTRGKIMVVFPMKPITPAWNSPL
jgi:hypothetical protein